jgi:hypothetical protein
MVAFPLELFRSIVKEIDDNRDLCVLAIVCRALQPEAERVLYRQLIGDGAREVVQVCKRICCSPRFGPYVRYFTADALDDGTFELMAFTRILRSALANLRYLHCHLFTDSQMIPPGAVLNGSLSTLLVFSSYFPIENNLIVFLERQKNLRQFSCWKGPVPEFMAISTPVSNHIMPKLEVLDLRECLDHSNIAIRLLPGRPITHLAVHRVDAMLLQCIALTTLPLQALCIMGDGLRPLSFYRHLSSAIPELAVLRGPSRIAKEVCIHNSLLHSCTSNHTFTLGNRCVYRHAVAIKEAPRGRVSFRRVHRPCCSRR